MTDDLVFEQINEAKANLDHIYDKPDPRSYFRELKKLGYVIPEEAKPVFKELISLRKQRDGEPVRILDLGCSYGINAALLKYDLSIEDLYEHWGQDHQTDLPTNEIIAEDRRFFASLDESDDVAIVGLDVAGNAVTFAETTGLLDDGIAVNLETESLPATAADKVRPTDLVMSTGCVGYVTEKSFDQLLPVVTEDRRPWIANFVLRMFPFDQIASTLAEWGYITEKLDGHTFMQRAFASPEEREMVLSELRDKGIDPTGHEKEGYLLAEFFLSRPADEAVTTPLGDLLSRDPEGRC